jgi:hypothetical protein
MQKELIDRLRDGVAPYLTAFGLDDRENPAV